MSKDKGNTATAIAPAAPQGALATANDFGGGLHVSGRSDTGSNLSRVVLFQGTAEESVMYPGNFKRGEFLDALEIRSLGDHVRIMPIFAFAQYAVWEKGQRAPVETWDDEKKVPAPLLEWGEENGKRVPPKAQMSINCVCAVNDEPWPYLMVFKRTGLKAFERTINPLEARRGSIGKCPGLYELGSTDDKNPDGQPYKRLTARPAGEPPAEMIELAKKVFQARQKFQTKATEMAKDEKPVGGFDPNAE